MQDSTLTDIDYPVFSIYIFKVNYVFIEEKDNPVGKVAMNEEEHDNFEIDCILNLENLAKTVLID